jgi:hypothetical protein
MRKINQTERGAVFIYILMAIVLLAALTYAVSHGNRGGTSTLTDQQAKLAAQEIIDYGNTVATAVQKLRLRGCSDTEISFENDASSIADYTNPNAPTDKSCHVFDINGGNVTRQIFNEAFFEPLLSNPVTPYFFFASGSAFKGFGEDCTAEDCLDLITYILVQENICSAINKMADVFSIPEDSDQIGNTFIGSYNVSTTTIVLDEPANNPLAGKAFGCFYENGDGSPNHVFYQILISR